MYWSAVQMTMQANGLWTHHHESMTQKIRGFARFYGVVSQPESLASRDKRKAAVEVVATITESIKHPSLRYYGAT